MFERDRFPTSKMTHPSYGSSADNYIQLGAKRFRLATTEEVPTVDEMYSREGGKDGDDNVPNLLPEDEIWDLLNDDFLTEESPDMIDLNELCLLPAQILAAGSQVLPEKEDDAPPFIQDSAATEDSQRSLSPKRRCMHLEASFTITKVEKNAVVGPNSVQMKAIKRILAYLKEAVDEDPQLLTMVHDVTQQCEIRHRRGENKYQHLPGAIFEVLVDTIGGPAFYRLYSKSKKFQDNHILHKEEESQELAVRVDPTPIEVQTPTRSLLSTAVAYGLHLAAVMRKENHNSLGEDEKSIEKAIHDGERVVSRMSDGDRNEFWEHFRNCDCVVDKQNYIGDFHRMTRLT